MLLRWFSGLTTAMVAAVVFAGCESDSPGEPTPPPQACAYLATPAEFTPCMSTPEEVALSVVAPPACPWTAVMNVPWLVPATPSQGTGNGLVRFSLADNWDAPRQGVITIHGDQPSQAVDVRVKQAGCYYGVDRARFDVPGAGGSYTFQVVQQSDPVMCGGPRQDACVWSAFTPAAWILIAGTMPRVGDQPVTFAVAANTSSALRTATIVVRDRTVQVVQDGRN